MWIRIEAEIEGAAAQLDTVVEPLPHLPTAARRSGSVGGAAIALKERLAQLARDIHKARGEMQAGSPASLKVPDELAPLAEFDRLRPLALPHPVGGRNSDSWPTSRFRSSAGWPSAPPWSKSQCHSRQCLGNRCLAR